MLPLSRLHQFYGIWWPVVCCYDRFFAL
jgi:hypothetical protein